MLAYGFLAQTGKRTVCGVLAGAGLSRLWPHDRAHSVFTRARWNPDDLGLAVARLVAGLLAPAGGAGGHRDRRHLVPVARQGGLGRGMVP